MSEVVRFDSSISFHLSKLSNAKFSILYDISLVRDWKRKLWLITLGSERVNPWSAWKYISLSNFFPQIWSDKFAKSTDDTRKAGTRRQPAARDDFIHVRYKWLALLFKSREIIYTFVTVCRVVELLWRTTFAACTEVIWFERWFSLWTETPWGVIFETSESPLNWVLLFRS